MTDSPPPRPAVSLLLSRLARLVPFRREAGELLYTAREALLIVDGAGRIRAANPVAAGLLGLPRDQLVDRRLAELIPRLMGPPGGWHAWTEHHLSRPDGSDRLVELIAVRQSRFLPRFTVTLHDLTQRDTAEREQRIAQERLELALSMAREIVWDWRPATGQVVVTTGREGMLGYPPEDLGQTFDWWIGQVHPEDRKRIEAALRRHLDAETELFEEEYRLRDASGEYRWAFTRGRAVERDDAGRPVRVIGTTIDRTERRLLEQQFVQAQKMEALGQLAGGVAHDFNNALQRILGMAELMAMRPDRTAEESQADLHEIRVAAERAGALTRQLLSFSSRQPARVELLDLDATIAEVTRLIRRLMGPNITIEAESSSEPALIRVDPALLEHAILNLALNARDAMPEGGRLTFRTSVRAGAVAEDPAAPALACLEVTDTGVGMDPELRARVFEPFFTTKPAGRGTGLGLPMVYNFVTQSGGRIEVDSTPGAGTTFRLLLPVARLQGRTPRATRERTMTRGAGTILIVEDEADIRALCRSALSELGYTVLVAANAEEAIGLLDHPGRPIHLVITDIVMPGRSGFELAQWIRTHRPGLPVGFISGFMQGTEEQLATVQVEHVLAKPFRLPDLADLVRRLLDPARPDAPPRG